MQASLLIVLTLVALASFSYGLQTSTLLRQRKVALTQRSLLITPHDLEILNIIPHTFASSQLIAEAEAVSLVYNTKKNQA